MTVCIAAMCLQGDKPAIIGASDRMFTAGDIVEFEPDKTKIANLHKKVVALVAGSSAAQESILQNVTERIKAEKLTRVKDIAEAYSEELIKVRLRKAEQEFLNPIGLDLKVFLEEIKKESSSDILSDLVCKMSRYRLGVETIIAGLDDVGAHLFEVSDTSEPNASAVPHNAAGFVAIGSGGFHASSQFMFQRYNGLWELSQALFLTYKAKRHSEISPGVGKMTDVFVINDFEPYYYASKEFPNNPDTDLDKIKQIYEKSETVKKMADTTAYKETNDLLESHRNQQNQSQEKKS